MRILALDASGASWSVALLDGDGCIGEHVGGDSRKASVDMPGAIQDLLAGGGLDAVGVTTGPGSFTGLRGALALAHGLALGAGVAVVGVTVAEALLHRVSGQTGAIWIALDARRPGRVFLDAGRGMVACTLDDLPQCAGPVLVLGDAAAAVAAVRPDARAGEGRVVRAADVARVAQRRLAGEIGPCAPQPLYVEPPAARPPA